MVKDAGDRNYRRIIHHLQVGRYRSVQRSLCPCRDGKEGMGEEALTISRPGWLSTGSADARFLPTAGSLLVRAVRQLVGTALLILLPVLGARGGTGLRGINSRDC